MTRITEGITVSDFDDGLIKLWFLRHLNTDEDTVEKRLSRIVSPRGGVRKNEVLGLGFSCCVISSVSDFKNCSWKRVISKNVN